MHVQQQEVAGWCASRCCTQQTAAAGAAAGTAAGAAASGRRSGSEQRELPWQQAWSGSCGEREGQQWHRMRRGCYGGARCAGAWGHAHQPVSPNAAMPSNNGIIAVAGLRCAVGGCGRPRGRACQSVQDTGACRVPPGCSVGSVCGWEAALSGLLVCGWGAALPALCVCGWAARGAALVLCAPVPLL